MAGRIALASGALLLGAVGGEEVTRRALNKGEEPCPPEYAQACQKYQQMAAFHRDCSNDYISAATDRDALQNAWATARDYLENQMKQDYLEINRRGRWWSKFLYYSGAVSSAGGAATYVAIACGSVVATPMLVLLGVLAVGGGLGAAAVGIGDMGVTASDADLLSRFKSELELAQTQLTALRQEYEAKITAASIKAANSLEADHAAARLETAAKAEVDALLAQYPQCPYCSVAETSLSPPGPITVKREFRWRGNE